MSWTDAILLLGAGLLTGIINTLAGGGSLLTLPLFIFMGLPAVEANASNRIGIFLQSLIATAGFRSKGVFIFPYALWVAISAFFGCIIGTYFATDIDNQLFNKVLAIIMVTTIVMTVLKPYFGKNKQTEHFTLKSKAGSIITFFFLGIYGGFIQAGVGFLMIATLTGFHGLSMAKTNSIKTFVIVCYTLVALAIFWAGGHIRWDYGLTLAAGNSAGGWIASRWSVGKDDKWIRLFLIVTVIGLAIKLWFF